jgi:hypothetical protein
MNVYIERLVLPYSNKTPVLISDMNTLDDLMEHINKIDQPVIVGRFNDGLKITPYVFKDNFSIVVDDTMDFEYF